MQRYSKYITNARQTVFSLKTRENSEMKRTDAAGFVEKIT